MDLHEKQQSDTKQYLLGSLPADLQEEKERNIMIDDGALETLEAAEDDLIEEYISGELTAAERVQFEVHFLVTPERRESLQFAMLLQSHLGRTQPADSETLGTPRLLQRFWMRPAAGYRAALIFAIILMVVGGFWLYRSRIDSPKSFATLSLSPSSITRGPGESIRRVTLTSEVDAVRLTLELPEEPATSSNYRVELLSEDGGTKTVPIASRNDKTLTLEIPASDFQSRQYVLKLFTRGEDGSERRLASYTFAVTRNSF